MNKQIVDYLQKNKDEYTKESLVEQLNEAGYGVAETTEAINSVYGEAVTENTTTTNKSSEIIKRPWQGTGLMIMLFLHALVYGYLFVVSVDATITILRIEIATTSREIFPIVTSHMFRHVILAAVVIIPYFIFRGIKRGKKSALVVCIIGLLLSSIAVLLMIHLALYIASIEAGLVLNFIFVILAIFLSYLTIKCWKHPFFNQK